MVWTACYLFWVLLDEFGYTGNGYTIASALYCAFATYVTSSNNGTTQFFMFQISYSIVVILLLFGNNIFIVF
jgi:dihydroceramidase